MEYTMNPYVDVHILKIKRYPLAYHQNSIRIVFVLEGEVTVKCAFRLSKLPAGKFMFINRNQVYSMWTDRNDYAVVEIISLNVDKLKGIFEELEYIRLGNTPYSEQDYAYTKVQVIREKTARRYMLECFDELQEAPFSAQEYLGEAAHRLITLCLGEYNFLYYLKPEIEYISKDSIERFHRAAGYVQSHLSEKIRLDDMAVSEQLGMTYFTQMWKDLTDLSFGEYVNYERVMYSEILLLFTDKKLFEISAACGFSDLKYYYKNFKHWFKQSPMQWKEQWLTHRGQDMEQLAADTARLYIDQYFEKHPNETPLKPRIYEQYRIIKEMASAHNHFDNMEVIFDLFAPENVPEQSAETTEVPEWSYIDLFFGLIQELGLQLQIQIRMEALQRQHYREAFELLIKRMTQYFGLKHVRTWKFHLICRDFAELTEAKAYVPILENKLNGGKIKYVLV